MYLQRGSIPLIIPHRVGVCLDGHPTCLSRSLLFPSAMALALLSALLTALFWLGSFLLLFGGLGYLIGQQYKKMVPPKQDHLPRHLLFWGPFLLGLAIGGLDGLHVAGPQAALAGGDAYLARQIIIKTPWSSSHNPTGSAVKPPTWGRALQTARQDMSLSHLALTLVGKAVLGPALAPVLSLKILARSYEADRLKHPNSTRSWSRVWWEASPQLEKLSQMTVLASLALGLLYLILMAIGFLALILSARRDLSALLSRSKP